jgi:integrase
MAHEEDPPVNTAKLTGYVRTIERRAGPVFYAHLRLPDGSQPQRRLGPAWLKRSAAPEGFLTPATAEVLLQELLLEFGAPVPAGATVTFEDAVNEWLRYVEHDRGRRPSTVRDYRNCANAYLIPAFGRRPVEAITTADIDRWRERLVHEGKLSARTINKQLALLHGIFKRAQRRYGVEGNPAAAAERQPEHRSGDFQVLEADEVILLAQHAADAQDGAIFTVAAFTGLRLGELLALRWSDVDFAKRLVHVRWSRVRGQTDRPKSHRVRSVPLIDQAARALDGLSRRGGFTADEDLVFIRADGQHLDGDQLRKRYRVALQEAGLPRIRFHDLRHTFGTLAVQAFPLSDVKAFMGHADVGTTMIYVHHVPRHDAAERLTLLVAEAGRAASVQRTQRTERNSAPLREPNSALWSGAPTDPENS